MRVSFRHFVVFGLMGLVAACGSTEAADPSVGDVDPAVEQVETTAGVDVLTAAADATFGVSALGCSLVPAVGSAVAVGPDLIATSAHTVAGADEIEVTAVDGTTATAELLVLDIAADLAVLRAPTRGFLELRQAEEGESARMLLWTETGLEARPVEVTKRLRVTIEDIFIEETVLRLGIEVAAEVNRGDSGAAVVGDDGKVLGIVYGASREREVGFATRVNALEEALDAVAAGVPLAISNERCVP